MKVLFVSSTLTSGGSERVISLLANHFASKDNEVEIVCLREPIVFYPIDKAVKITFAEKELKRKSLIEKVFWLRHHVKETKPDVVVSFMILVYLTTLLALLGVNVPIITSERNDPASFSWWKRVLRWLLLPTTTCHVVQTQRIKSYYSKYIQNKTVVIGNPVTNKVFSVQPEEKQDVIINVARLFPQKNQEMLIKAFSRIKDEIPTYNLKIFGEGPLREKLTKLIADEGVGDRVLLLGRSQQVIEEMNRSSFFVLSSNHEGLSNAMIEAICIGLPVISTNVSGTEELLEDGVNGLITDVGNEKQMSDAILKLARDNRLRLSMSKENVKKATSFKESSILKRWTDLVEKVAFERKHR